MHHRIYLHMSQGFRPLRFWAVRAMATDLRSRTPKPASFMACPSIFHSSSQLGGLSLVSEERPMAFKKSSGVLIASAGRAPCLNTAGSRGGGMGLRLGASGRMMRERVRDGIEGSILGATSLCKFKSDMAIVDALKQRPRR